ncbi:protein LEG1 homolog [Ptychodera flava]|uniref:protein LEG1 homolog n=1 Tax=Ptychodera flava TaxID=63121 RepID=UPI00396A347E
MASVLQISFIASLVVIGSWQLFSEVAKKMNSAPPGDVGCTEQVHLPPYWPLAPSRITDYPIANKTVQINPWHYLHRLGLYKILLNATSHCREEFGTDNLGNVMWGLPLQYGWQLESGRLNDPRNSIDSEDEFYISSESWWASINYYLSVLPFIGAAEAGMVDLGDHVLEFTAPAQRSDQYCRTVQSCRQDVPETVRKWKMYFEELKTSADFHGKNAPYSFDGVLGALWDAHTESLKVMDRFEQLEHTYSSVERAFFIGWGFGLTRYLNASHFNTNHTNVDTFQTKFLT